MDAGYVLGPGEGRGGERRFLGKPIRVLADGTDTRGAYQMFEQRLEGGFRPPLHTHHTDDEAFYVLSGALRVACGEERWEAGSGGFVFLPRGIPHSFLVTSPSATLLQLSNPAGFEHFAADVADLQLGEEHLAGLTEAARRHGIAIHGPSPFETDRPG